MEIIIILMGLSFLTGLVVGLQFGTKRNYKNTPVVYHDDGTICRAHE